MFSYSTSSLAAVFKRVDFFYYELPTLDVNQIAWEPDDPLYNQQWALKKINVEHAWRYTSNIPGIVVAVIDSGIDFSHEDLQDQTWINDDEIPNNGLDDDQNGFIDDYQGWDFVDSDNEPFDEGLASTGTFYSGIIAALKDNSLGIAGIAPNINLMSIRFLGKSGSGNMQSAVKSIDYAVENGADIILTNWGSFLSKERAKPLINAAKRAHDSGVTIIAPAGSYGNDRASYPAAINLPNVISVTATDRSDVRPPWANYGDHITIAAPGSKILGTQVENNYRILSGTASASAILAGSIALIKSYSKSIGLDLSHSKLQTLIQATGAPADVEIPCNCRIDVGAAIKALESDSI